MICSINPAHGSDLWVLGQEEGLVLSLGKENWGVAPPHLGKVWDGERSREGVRYLLG